MKHTITILLSITFSCLAWAGDVSIENPYVRAMPPGQKVTVAYMTLKNSGDMDRALVKADSDVAESAELHTHIHEDGMMKMRPVEKVNIAKNGMAELKPGSFHIMLIGLKRTLATGEKVDITLTFDDGSTESVQAPVQRMEMEMKMKMKGDRTHMKHNH